jgi:hypothetical protein
LEASDNTILDFVQVLYTLCDVNHEIWSGTFWTEAPDLSRFGDIILVFLIEISGTDFEVLLGIDFILFLTRKSQFNKCWLSSLVSFIDSYFVNIFRQTVWHWQAFHVQSVVFVWRLGQAHDV